MRLLEGLVTRSLAKRFLGYHELLKAAVEAG
jgi:hypothetical protein